MCSCSSHHYPIYHPGTSLILTIVVKVKLLVVVLVEIGWWWRHSDRIGNMMMVSLVMYSGELVINEGKDMVGSRVVVMALVNVLFS
jgi:hypothetical protein